MTRFVPRLRGMGTCVFPPFVKHGNTKLFRRIRTMTCLRLSNGRCWRFWRRC